MVLGEPHVIEPSALGGKRRPHRGIQHLGVRLPGKLRRQQQHPGPYPLDVRHNTPGYRTAAGDTLAHVVSVRASPTAFEAR